MTLLSLENLSVRQGARVVVEPATFALEPGQVVGLIGPNGAGKTTLMRGALGLLPHGGQSSVTAMPVRARARHVAWLPQVREIAWPIPVRRLVLLGRVPHLAAGQTPTGADERAVDAALGAMGLGPFADRPATELSGGEQARVLIARALAQETPLLLADEPAAGLDPAHQIGAMEAFRAKADGGGTVLVSLHDLGLAARQCDRLLMMDGGRIVADGPPSAVLTASHLATVFGITAHLADGPDGPIFQPLSVLPTATL